MGCGNSFVDLFVGLEEFQRREFIRNFSEDLKNKDVDAAGGGGEADVPRRKSWFELFEMPGGASSSEESFEEDEEDVADRKAPQANGQRKVTIDVPDSGSAEEGNSEMGNKQDSAENVAGNLSTPV